MSISDNTPILVGVGEVSERIEAPDYAERSPVELAAAAAQVALEDALSVAKLAPEIDVIASIRQFEISHGAAVAPFGHSNNFPRSIAKRIGANPARAVLEISGGQGPQHLINEFSQEIAKGEIGMALIVGSEAISTMRHVLEKKETRDWSETVSGTLEDRGYGVEGLLTPDLIQHGARTPIQMYALFENARRARLGLDRASYALEMGRLFAPFTKVAAQNPHAMSQQVFTAEELATVTPKNRLVADPFPRRMVARDQANQGAAVLFTSVGKARALGIPEEKWVYLHGGADAKERIVMERQDLSKSKASVRTIERALEVANLALSDIDVIDLYSCFPIAVFNITDAFGLKADDPRGLTVTGGLPFFGGAGNNYSMHAIATMVQRLRSAPGKFGLVAANGGFLSKYSVGVYSTRPAAWKGFDSKALQAEVDGWAAPSIDPHPTGRATVETYTVDYSGPEPRGLLIGRTAADARFVALADDPAVVQTLIAEDPTGATIDVIQNEKDRAVVTGVTPR